MPEPEKAVEGAEQEDESCASGEGGQQDQDKVTFPSVQAQLDEIRPLLNGRLQEGTTW